MKTLLELVQALAMVVCIMVMVLFFLGQVEWILTTQLQSFATGSHARWTILILAIIVELVGFLKRRCY